MSTASHPTDSKKTLPGPSSPDPSGYRAPPSTPILRLLERLWRWKKQTTHPELSLKEVCKEYVPIPSQGTPIPKASTRRDNNQARNTKEINGTNGQETKNKNELKCAAQTTANPHPPSGSVSSSSLPCEHLINAPNEALSKIRAVANSLKSCNAQDQGAITEGTGVNDMARAEGESAATVPTLSVKTFDGSDIPEEIKPKTTKVTRVPPHQQLTNMAEALGGKETAALEEKRPDRRCGFLSKASGFFKSLRGSITGRQGGQEDLLPQFHRTRGLVEHEVVFQNLNIRGRAPPCFVKPPLSMSHKASHRPEGTKCSSDHKDPQTTQCSKGMEKERRCESLEIQESRVKEDFICGSCSSTDHMVDSANVDRKINDSAHQLSYGHSHKAEDTNRSTKDCKSVNINIPTKSCVTTTTTTAPEKMPKRHAVVKQQQKDTCHLATSPVTNVSNDATHSDTVGNAKPHNGSGDTNGQRGENTRQTIGIGCAVNSDTKGSRKETTDSPYDENPTEGQASENPEEKPIKFAEGGDDFYNGDEASKRESLSNMKRVNKDIGQGLEELHLMQCIADRMLIRLETIFPSTDSDSLYTKSLSDRYVTLQKLTKSMESKINRFSCSTESLMRSKCGIKELESPDGQRKIADDLAFLKKEILSLQSWIKSLHNLAFSDYRSKQKQKQAASIAAKKTQPNQKVKTKEPVQKKMPLQSKELVQIKTLVQTKEPKQTRVPDQTKVPIQDTIICTQETIPAGRRATKKKKDRLPTAMKEEGDQEYRCPFAVASHYDDYYIHGQKAKNKEQGREANPPKKLKRYQLASAEEEETTGGSRRRKKKGKPNTPAAKAKWQSIHDSRSQQANKGKSSSCPSSPRSQSPVDSQGVSGAYATGCREKRNRSCQRFVQRQDDRHLYCEARVLSPKRKSAD